MKKIIGAGLAFAPFLAFAQLTESRNIVDAIGNIVDILTPIVFALALLYFFWGLAQFILNSGNDDARTEGKNKMIWGVVAIAVMASVFGLVGFLQDELSIADENPANFTAPSVPTVPTPNTPR